MANWDSGVRKVLVFGWIAIEGSLASAQTAHLRAGDLIFHQSQTRQAKAIEEAQGSPWTHMGILFPADGRWYVAEAIQPVTVTSLERFIQRGRNRTVLVKRIRSTVIDMSDEGNQSRVAEEVEKEIGKNYDIFFSWSDERIYCSELVFKAFSRATGWAPGLLQRFRDLNLDGPAMKRLIREREAAQGRPIDLDEPIITPVSILRDQSLESVPFHP